MKMAVNPYIGNNLRALRNQCGYTQAFISQILKIDRSVYNCYELGRTSPSCDTLEQLAKLFHVPMETLLHEMGAVSGSSMEPSELRRIRWITASLQDLSYENRSNLLTLIEESLKKNSLLKEPENVADSQARRQRTYHYPSDISREQFECVKKDLRDAIHNRRNYYVDLYEIFCAVLYYLKSGCQWRMLPSDFPCPVTVHKYFKIWSINRLDGTCLLTDVLKRVERNDILARWEKRKNENVSRKKSG